MIDLEPFCGKEGNRPYLHHPFSRDEFTFATDGRICVRVPRIAGIPERDKHEINPTNLPWDQTAEFSPLPELKLPPQTTDMELCACYGGKIHDCPDCECECENCDGRGETKVNSDDDKSIDILALPFGLRYVRLVTTLPNVQIAKIAWPNDTVTGLRFKFDGGDGLLMPLKSACNDHIGGAL